MSTKETAADVAEEILDALMRAGADLNGVGDEKLHAAIEPTVAALLFRVAKMVEEWPNAWGEIDWTIEGLSEIAQGIRGFASPRDLK